MNRRRLNKIQKEIKDRMSGTYEPLSQDRKKAQLEVSLEMIPFVEKAMTRDKAIKLIDDLESRKGEDGCLKEALERPSHFLRVKDIERCVKNQEYEK